MTVSSLAKGQLVTVFGGSGFLGRYVVQTLARARLPRPRRGAPSRISHNISSRRNGRPDSRRPGQSALSGIGARRRAGCRRRGQSGRGFCRRADARPSPPADDRSRRRSPVRRLGGRTHDPCFRHRRRMRRARGNYGRTKAGGGEPGPGRAAPEAVILRPSIIFGPGDSFFTGSRPWPGSSPSCPSQRRRPASSPFFAGDVAEAVARAVDNAVEGGRIYELGGPSVYSFRELLCFFFFFFAIRCSP